ncbi:STE3-domain-containing protein [Peniophora sp. CONT]|nr:STE3-domain-containing protein [Peniophora sp. CONT]
MRMAAVDPTYPLYPVICVVSSVSLLFVLLTNAVRHSWNLGVAFLCFWLFFENLTNAVNAIIWSDNAAIKHYVYCDIVSRVQMITFVVKPTATLIITRRLYLVICPRSTNPHDKTIKRWDRVIEWILGLGIPVLVAGPVYYVNQNARFQVLEGFGCTNTMAGSILAILLVRSWSVIPPLLSIALYYSRMARTFYRQTKDVTRLLHDNASVSRRNYLRVLALASLDILLTLPFGAVNIVLSTIVAVNEDRLPFYPGWTKVHSDWTPKILTWADIRSSGKSALPQDYFNLWTSPVLALAIFGLFGLTTEARASYEHIFRIVRGWLGCKLPPRSGNSRSGTLETIKFEEQMQEVVLDIKGSSTSSVGFEVVVLQQVTEDEEQDATRERNSLEKLEDVHYSPSDVGTYGRREPPGPGSIHPVSV